MGNITGPCDAMVSGLMGTHSSGLEPGSRQFPWFSEKFNQSGGYAPFRAGVSDRSHPQERCEGIDERLRSGPWHSSCLTHIQMHASEVAGVSSCSG